MIAASVPSAMPPSDCNDYDSDDKAMVSALAPLMMRKKTRDDLVESGYNRYAYNDDQVLPLPRGASRTAQNM